MTPEADMYPEYQAAPKEEQAAELWLEAMKEKEWNTSPNR